MKNYSKNPDVEKAFRIYYPRLLSTAYGVLDDEAEAEEVVSHSFEQLLKCKDIETMTIYVIAAFLKKTAGNYTVDLLRKRKVKKKNLKSIAANVARYYEDAWAYENVFTENCEMLKEVIAELPPRQKEIVVEKYIKGRSAQEISSSLGITISTVNNTLKDAIKNLRKKFAERDKW